MSFLKLRLVCWWALLLVLLPFSSSYELETPYTITTDGPDSLKEGKRLFAEANYDKAAVYFWRAVLLQEQSADAYSVEDAFSGFLQTYSVQDRTADGFVYIAKESMQRDQKEMAQTYLKQALSIDPHNEGALELQQKFAGGGSDRKSKSRNKNKKRENKFQPNYGTPEADRPLDGKSPEDLYEYGATLFSRRNYEHCADVFELSCRRSNYQLGPSCSNGVYCKHMIMDWGFNGTGFDEDMRLLESITQMEAENYRQGDLDLFSWQRAASVHPHMMLGYPLSPILKRYVSESVAYMDETMARVSKDGSIKPLSSDMPFDHTPLRSKYIEEASEPGFKLKVGFVGSGFNSKAVLYLSQDIFRFYDRSQIEMHIFSVGPADNEQFIEVSYLEIRQLKVSLARICSPTHICFTDWNERGGLARESKIARRSFS
jgi:protein O-GlcNAc transferase